MRTRSAGSPRNDYIGDPNVAFFLESSEETGGLDLIRVERKQPFEFVALMRERNFPSLQRVIFKLDAAASAGDCSSLKYRSR
jgi:hypothetical protein